MPGRLRRLDGQHGGGFPRVNLAQLEAPEDYFRVPSMYSKRSHGSQAQTVASACMCLPHWAHNFWRLGPGFMAYRPRMAEMAGIYSPRGPNMSRGTLESFT